MRHSGLVRFVAAAELPFILAIAPLLLFPTPGRLTVLAAVPIIWVCAKVTTGRFVPSTPLNASLWLLLAMVGLSLYATFSIRYSLGKVAGVLLGVLLFWAITRWITTPERLKAATVVYLAAGAGLAVIALLTAPENFSAVSSTLLRRVIHGVSGEAHPNPLAGCLLLFVPVQVAVLAAASPRWWPRPGGRWVGAAAVWVQFALLALTVTALILMRSRGAGIGLAVAGFVFLLTFSRRTRIAAMAGVAALVLTVSIAPGVLSSDALSKSGSSLLASVSLRTALWSKAIEAIRDAPATGLGMNTFRKVMPVRYPLFPPPIFPGPDLAHAHNNLLQAALDLGIPGVVAYASLWLVAAVLLVRVIRYSGDRMYRALASGLGFGLIAHFVFGMADAIPLGSKLGVVFWLALALTVALHDVASVRPGTSQHSSA